jgi:DNA-binding transcriptional LysR family regulator
MGDHIPDSETRPTVRELEILRAMIGSGKTVAAAQSLGMSQPAVSRALATLESKIGRALFVRDGARLAPTATALTLEQDGSEILSALDRLVSRNARGRVESTMRIALPPTLAQYLLPQAVTAFRRIEPDVTIEIEIGKGPDVIAAIADRQADLGIADSPAMHPAVRSELLREGTAHAIVPAGHRVARLSEVTPHDLAGEPFVALARRFASRAEFERAFEAAGIARHIVAEVSTSACAVQLVKAGLGITLLNPFPVTLSDFDGLAAVPFTPTVSYRTCLLLPVSGTRNPAARRFADFIKVQLRDGKATPRLA